MTASRADATAQKYRMVAVDKLVPHPRNVNIGDDRAIRESIENSGFFGTLVVQAGSNVVIAGNHRLKAAKQLGMDKVPCVFVDVDDERALRMLLADNRTARQGHDDRDALADLLTELADGDDGLLGTGYDDDFLAKLTADPDPTPVVDANGDKGAERWAVIVECTDEAEQTAVAELVAGAGHGSEIRKVVDR